MADKLTLEAWEKLEPEQRVALNALTDTFAARIKVKDANSVYHAFNSYVDASSVGQAYTTKVQGVFSAAALLASRVYAKHNDDYGFANFSVRPVIQHDRPNVHATVVIVRTDEGDDMDFLYGHYLATPAMMTFDSLASLADKIRLFAGNMIGKACEHHNDDFIDVMLQKI